MFDLIIVGSGPAGLSAGIYASRFNYKVLIIEGKMPGGWPVIAGKIENYPGVTGADGVEIMETMRSQCEKIGVAFKSGAVTSIAKNKKNIFLVETGGGEKFEGKSLVLSHGTSHRKLGLPNEELFMGKGLSICAICDAPLYKGKVVAIAGGGDSSVKSLPMIAEYAKFVYLITRNKTLSAEPINLERLQKVKNSAVLYENEVSGIFGENMLSSIELKNEYKGSKKLEVGGLFIMIGFVTMTDFFKDLGVLLDGWGYVMVDNLMKTNISGVFAAGDCTNSAGSFKQMVVSSSQGAIAAASVNEYLQKI